MINPQRHAIAGPGSCIIRQGRKEDEPEPPKVIHVNFFPQDALVGIVEDLTIPAAYAQDGRLASPRVAIDDSGPIARPDENGNMKYPPTDPRFTQVEVLVSADATIGMWEKYAGHRIEYAFGRDQITALPDAGEDFNAYYARWEGSINFFHAYDDRYPCKTFTIAPAVASRLAGKAPLDAMKPGLAVKAKDDCGKMIYSGQSNEVTSHEEGHATLDGWKPNYLSWSPDAGGFHESFGDITGILRSLDSDPVVEKMLADTGGDIRKSSVVTKLGEELSRGIADVILRLPPEEAEKFVIRDAANKLVWSDPADLPRNPKDPDQLGSEVHNYSRLFTGTFWDIYCGMYERNLAAGDDAKAAVAKARTEAGTLMARMLEFAPDSIDAYRQLGKAMLVADAKSMDGRNHDLIAGVMLKRKILTEEDIQNPAGKVPRMKLPEAYDPVSGKGETAKGVAQQLLWENGDLLGISVDDFPEPTHVVRNTAGEKFYHYQWTKVATLRGPQFKQYDGALIDVHGSLVLAFDRRNTLMHVENTPVSADRVAAAKEQVRTLINEGEVKFVKPFQAFKSRDFFKSDGSVYTAYTTYTNNGVTMKVARVPILQ